MIFDWKKYRIPFFALLLLALAAFSGCGQKQEPVTKHGFYFDTVIQITLYDRKYEPLIDDCFSMAEEFEQKVSKTLSGSEIYALNHAEGAPVSLSEDTLSLLQTGLAYCEKSGGSFDITIGALAELWDIGQPRYPGGFRRARQGLHGRPDEGLSQ